MATDAESDYGTATGACGFASCWYLETFRSVASCVDSQPVGTTSVAGCGDHIASNPYLMQRAQRTDGISVSHAAANSDLTRFLIAQTKIIADKQRNGLGGTQLQLVRHIM